MQIHSVMIWLPITLAAAFSAGNKRIPMIAQIGDDIITNNENTHNSLYLKSNLCSIFQNSNVIQNVLLKKQGLRLNLY